MGAGERDLAHFCGGGVIQRSRNPVAGETLEHRIADPREEGRGAAVTCLGGLPNEVLKRRPTSGQDTGHRLALRGLDPAIV
jgi:hypothetical protein